jgi:hypothetical protein
MGVGLLSGVERYSMYPTEPFMSAIRIPRAIHGVILESSPTRKRLELGSICVRGLQCVWIALIQRVGCLSLTDDQARGLDETVAKVHSQLN